MNYDNFDFSKTVNGIKTLAPVYEWIKGGRTTEEIEPTVNSENVSLNIPGIYDLTYQVNDIKKMLHIEVKPIEITVEMETSTQILTEEIAAEIQPDCSVPVIIQERDKNDIPIWVNEIVSNTKPDDSYKQKKVQTVQDNLPIWVNGDNNIIKAISKPSNYDPLLVQESTSTGKRWVKKIVSNTKPDDSYKPLMIQKTQDNIPVWLKKS